MGQGNSQHLTHTWMEKMVQKPQYITRKGIQRKGDGRKTKKSKRLKKYNSKTTVKRKNSILLMILLGHDRRCFLYLCMCNFFPLTLYTNIFSLDSDQLFLPLSTNSLFGFFGPESIPVLGSSQNWSLQLASSVGKT